MNLDCFARHLVTPADMARRPDATMCRDGPSRHLTPFTFDARDLDDIVSVAKPQFSLAWKPEARWSRFLLSTSSMPPSPQAKKTKPDNGPNDAE